MYWFIFLITDGLLSREDNRSIINYSDSLQVEKSTKTNFLFYFKSSTDMHGNVCCSHITVTEYNDEIIVKDIFMSVFSVIHFHPSIFEHFYASVNFSNSSRSAMKCDYEMFNLKLQKWILKDSFSIICNVSNDSVSFSPVSITKMLPNAHRPVFSRKLQF